MSAVGGPEVIRVDTAPSVPVPPQGGVLIEVEASSLAFTDMLIRRNLYPLLKPVPPVLLGYDLVGVVRTHGAGVNAPAVGTRVAALAQIGGGQDWICLAATELVPLASGLDPVQAEPLILSYLTAYQALVRTAALSAGGRLLVIGASGAVGLAALDLAAALGWHGTGVASSAREDLVRSSGADFVPYDRGDPGQRVDAMGGRVGGFGAILGCAGAESPRRLARRLSARGH
ncbi:MAG: alcohol dehydrogenase catalytic domain-containing protein [Betaproteobacteria bacterium]